MPAQGKIESAGKRTGRQRLERYSGLLSGAETGSGAVLAVGDRGVRLPGERLPQFKPLRVSGQNRFWEPVSASMPMSVLSLFDELCPSIWRTTPHPVNRLPAGPSRALASRAGMSST
jgi:hypothetical protein